MLRNSRSSIKGKQTRIVQAGLRIRIRLLNRFGFPDPVPHLMSWNKGTQSRIVYVGRFAIRIRLINHFGYPNSDPVRLRNLRSGIKGTHTRIVHAGLRIRIRLLNRFGFPDPDPVMLRNLRSGLKGTQTCIVRIRIRLMNRFGYPDPVV